MEGSCQAAAATARSMEPIDIARLEEAVIAFYRVNAQDQAVTHGWLTDAEASPQAWQFSWQFMQLGKVSCVQYILFASQDLAGPAHRCTTLIRCVYTCTHAPPHATPFLTTPSLQFCVPAQSQEVQFFGAITLHSKLMKHWHEVPPENREELKQKILETIVQFARGPKIVLNRLCIALGAYIVHMLDDWPRAIEEVIETFQNQRMPNVTSDIQLWIMLEVLQAIPEEAQVIHTSVKRVTLRAELGKRVPLVLQTNESFLRQQMNRVWDAETYSNMIRAVKCVGTWIK